MATLTQIDLATFSRQSASEVNPMGPFKAANGFQYWVGVSTISGGVGVRKLRIFKSTDLWVTDTEMDVANAPTPIKLQLEVNWDSANDIISVLYNDDTDGKAKIIQFDCATDLYGTPGTGLANASAPWTANTPAFFRRTDGTYVVLFGSGGNFNYWTYAAGVWSAPTSLAAFQYIPRGQIYDTVTGIAHLVFLNAPGTALLYAQLSPAYSLSAPITLVSVNIDGFRASLVFLGAGIAVGYSNGISYEAFASGVAPYTAYVSVAPDRSAPVFTRYTIFTANGSASDAPTYVTLVIDDAGKLNAFFYETEYEAPPYVDRIWLTRFDGVAFETPLLFFDEVANPPPNSDTQFNQFLHTGDVLAFNGFFNLALALETVDSGRNHCTGFIAIGPQIPDTLTIACPIGGGTASIGVPYSKTIVVVGGTPPYTFALV